MTHQHGRSNRWIWRLSGPEKKTAQLSDSVAPQIQEARPGGLAALGDRLDGSRRDRRNGHLRLRVAGIGVGKVRASWRRVTEKHAGSGLLICLRSAATACQRLKRLVDHSLSVDETYDRVLLRRERVRGLLEVVFGRDKGAIQLVVGCLQIGDPVLVSRLHFLVAMVLGGNNAVLEHHVHGRKRHPTQENQREPGDGRLKRGAEAEKLHPPVAADVYLPFRKGFMEPRPNALHERFRHTRNSLYGDVGATIPNLCHFNPIVSAGSSF